MNLRELEYLTALAQARNFRRAAEMIYTLREWYGPTVKAFEAVGPAGAAALERDLIVVVEEAARARDGAIAVPAEYLEVVAVKR